MSAAGLRPAGRARSWAAALGFWVFTYGLLSARGALLHEPMPIFHFRRLVATAAGAILLGLVLQFMRGAAGRSTAARMGLALAAILPSATLMLGVHWGLESWASGHAVATAPSLIWTIVWTGYFVAWLGVCIALEATGAAAAAAALAAAGPGPGAEERAADRQDWVQGRGRAERVRIDAIEWAEAEGNYVRIHSSGGSTLIRLPLARIEDLLRPHGFVRVHRSALCREAEVTAVKRKQSGALVAMLRSGAQVPVSRAAASALRNGKAGETM
jgi:DNA-binding LytR/AlgR family response regulator